MMRQLDMSIYLKHLKRRYIQANRKNKTRILDEFCATSGFHRKHVIRLINQLSPIWRTQSTGRKKHYESDELLATLKSIWLATDQMCAKRLKAAIPLWLPHYEKMQVIDPLLRQQLISMSARTIDRLL